MRHSPSRTIRPLTRIIGSLLLAAAALVWGGAREAQAQQPAPALRWDGFFELVTGRHGMAPPTWTPPQPADAPSRVSRHAISRDGRYVVFDSDATNWGYSSTALYRRDRQTGLTDLLLAGPAVNASISGDGNHIAFEICEPWMRPDSAYVCDAWALDLRTWSWSLLSGTPNGTFGSHNSGAPVLSADGRFAAFLSTSPNLTGDVTYRRHVVLRDRDPDGNGIYDEPGTATLQTISVGLPTFANGDSDTPEISDDGRFVAFRSAASNLVAGDTNATWDVFLRDRQAGETRRLDVDPQGGQSLAGVDEPHLSMSADGRYVAFSSIDGQLAASAIDDVNGVRDIFVYDRQAFTLSRLDVGRAAGAPALGNAPSRLATLSADGRYVVLESAATNVDVPPAGNIGQVYVIDRATGQATRVSRARQGLDNAVPASRPSISGDGSVVLFWSTATAFARIAPPVAEQLYAAVHLAIDPADVTVAARGGDAAFTVTTQPHTFWWAMWDPTASPWVLPTQAPQGVGSGTMQFTVGSANPDGAPRTATITLGDAAATVTQAAGLSLIAVTPASGPVSGGTLVTLTGTGFEPGMIVYFGGAPAAVEYVDTTTLRVTTPPSDDGQPHQVPVAAGTDDGRYDWLDWAFEYTPSPDATPPIVVGSAIGPVGSNGWFVGDVSVAWMAYDLESPVTSAPCATVTVTQDTPQSIYVCDATSAGGTASQAVTVRRDTTPPVVAVSSPVAGRLYDRDAVVPSAFTCTDATSGVAHCGMAAPSGPPIETAVPGWRTFAPAAMDVAGNLGWTPVEYAVSTGVCAAPVPGLTSWLRFDGNLADVMGVSNAAISGGQPDLFVAGRSGQAYQFVQRTTGAVLQYHGDRLDFSTGVSLAAWVRPEATSTGYLVHNYDQYRIQRNGDGTITWYLYRTYPEAHGTGTSTATLPLGQWSHVALTFEGGQVALYVNGRLDRSWSVPFTSLRQGVFSSTPVRIGGDDFTGPNGFVGALDELEFADRALTAAEIEALFLSGAAGTCAPAPTTLTVAPITASYGAGTYQATATLRDAHGAPLAGKPVRLTSYVVPWNQSPPSTTIVTDAAGEVHWNAPFSATVGTYATGLTANFPGDLVHAHSSWVTVPVVVQQGTPQITWAPPAAITYGTPLGAAQLNATANVPGSFWYEPDWDDVLHTGIRTITAHFRPSDWTNYSRPELSVQIEVRKAIPNLTITGGTFTYDAQPHGATATATDYRGVALGTPTITYGGSPTPPVDAGVYTAVASFPGDADHEPRTVSGTITIVKRDPGISFSSPMPLTITYDGQPHALTATFLALGGGSLGQRAVTYNGSSTPPVDTGVYTVSTTFEGNENYKARTVTNQIRINPAVPTVTIGGGPFVYDGQPHPAVVTVTGAAGEAVPGPVTVTYGVNGSNGTTPPVNANTHYVQASVAAAGNYAAASGTGTIVIGKASVTITIVAGTVTYDGAVHPATVTTTGGGGQSLFGTTVTYNGQAGSPINAGTYAVHAAYPGDSNHEAATADATLVILKAQPTLSWSTPAAITYPAALTSWQLSVSSNVGGTFVYAPAAGTVLEPGTHTLTATLTSASANFENGTVTTTLTVRRATPTVYATGGTFYYDAQPHAAIQAMALGVGGVDLTPVTVTYNGSAALPVNAGTYAVVASFAGDARHAPASATSTLTINQWYPPISWNPQWNFTYGTALGAAHFNATSTVAGTFTYSPAVGTVFDASYPAAQTITLTFTPADTQNYLVRTITRSVYVYKASPSMSVAGGATIYNGQPHPRSGSATGVGGVALTPVTITYNDSPDPPVAAGTYTVRASYAGDTNYNAGSATTTLTIAKAAAGVVWNTPAAIRYGTPLGAAQLNATAAVPGTFSYTPAAGTVLGPGSPTLTATFTPTDGQNHNAATVTTTIVVQRALPTITVTGGSFTYDGQPHPAPVSATGVGGIALSPVSLTYNGSTAVPVGAGTYNVVATFTGDQNHEGATATATITIGKSAPALSWAAPASLPYGPTLNATQLNAQASVPGTFSYSPGLSSRLPAGTHTLSATFTPTDTTNYASGGTVSTSITIVPTPLEIRTLDTAKAFGAPVPAFAASYTGLASGETVAVLSGTLVFATTAASNSPVGTYAVTPAGLSSPNYAISFVAGTLSVVRAPVTMTLTASPTPSGLDMPITITATVAPAQSAPTAPSGTVRFFDGATLLGTATVSGGTATLVTGGLTAGTHSVEARYDGDASFETGTRTASHVVTTSAATPAITLASSRQPASTGQSMTFTATITVATSGTIAFYDGNTLLGSGSIASGRATWTVASFPAGSHAITARFQGTASAPPVISPVFVQAVTSSGWKDRTSSLALVSSANPSALGATVTFTATAGGSSGTPTGRILFMVDGLIVGDPTGVAMSGSGQASVSVSTLNGGRHKVTATYLGNSNYRGSNGALTQTVN